MNVQTILALAAIVLVGSTEASGSSSGSSSGNTCTTNQQASGFVSLASLLSLTTFSGCATDSGYSLTSSTALPTNAEYTKMCASTNCQSLVKSIISLNPPDCVMTVPTSGLKVNVYELANGFSAKCSSLSTSASTSSSTGSSSSASSTTIVAPTATTATPTATTTTPTSSSAAGSSTSSTTKTPSATTATPKTSSASSERLAPLTAATAVSLLAYLLQSI